MPGPLGAAFAERPIRPLGAAQISTQILPKWRLLSWWRKRRDELVERIATVDHRPQPAGLDPADHLDLVAAAPDQHALQADLLQKRRDQR